MDFNFGTPKSIKVDLYFETEGVTKSVNRTEKEMCELQTLVHYILWVVLLVYRYTLLAYTIIIQLLNTQIRMLIRNLSTQIISHSGTTYLILHPSQNYCQKTRITKFIKSEATFIFNYSKRILSYYIL